MKTKSCITTAVAGVALLGLVHISSIPASAQGEPVERDLQEWLDAQGTLNPIVWPQNPDTPFIFGWLNNPDINGDGAPDGPAYFIWFDYAGVLSRVTSTGGGALGPERITGRVTEKPIGDGLSEITVRLKIKGALCWVYDLDTGDVVLGNFDPAVADGAEPAVADANFTIQYLQTTGTPLMDLIEVFVAAGDDWPEFWPRFIFSMDAWGPLSEVFHPDVPAGTLGHLHWAKPGLQDSPAAGKNSNGAGALYPNDTFQIHPIQLP